MIIRVQKTSKELLKDDCTMGDSFVKRLTSCQLCTLNYQMYHGVGSEGVCGYPKL